MAEDAVSILRYAGWQIDLGAGNRLDAELTPDGAWLAAGSRIDAVSVWMKEVDGYDIKVGIERRPDGLVITLDRGDNQPPWWPDHGAPEILLRVNRAARTAKLMSRASKGEGEVLLAQTGI